jgi:archaemetzincin
MRNALLIFGLLFCVFLLISCKKDIKQQNQVKETSAQTIYILPLGEVNRSTISAIETGVTRFYKKKVVILSPVPLSPDILAKSKTRYEASKILNKFKSNNNTLIITEKDIAVKYERRHTDEWGIFGLGTCPGKICVVSTFRLKRKATEKLFTERLIKVCIHELGHNLGLSHCNADPKCLMNDANGTIKQVDKEALYFCPQCRKKLETR